MLIFLEVPSKVHLSNLSTPKACILLCRPSARGTQDTNSSDLISFNYRCWIANPYIHYTVNISYFALVFIFMTGIFTFLTTVVNAKLLRVTDGKRKTFRKQLMMVLSLFLLFGLSWSVAVTNLVALPSH